MIFKFPWQKSTTENTFFLSYDSHRDNFGDILNPIIAKEFSKNKDVKKISKRKSSYFEHYYIIGSILQRCNKNTIVWGSGIISEDSVIKEKPKKVLAVRGPLTRKKLLEFGVECPEVYGDPALLLPRFHNPKNIARKFELGIIPHYRDKKNKELLKFLERNPDIKVIDVQNKNPLKVVDEILECKNIISSSLHGIIVADAYNIPSAWINFSDKVVGNGFKFRDYFASVGRTEKEPYDFNEIKDIDNLLDLFSEEYTINIDLDKLIAAFPN
ncbi:polysaccharide pyruvyl transferase family protein [Tenacibaculum sp. 1_MG-2023]|uniref:polysaccharide pyruvyl transferase family protein n=1 Tax=Tenacibaculum sp. 1_MG-2023 TaxID=3062653 RepID=UPI0026E16267|nr:polysaccharide pyruvyl transferase family protein [Tenacibaculum sp. 1_MG-2023]MDO6601008.1 polysaccharide pyruvyl transferase family protein [Tenacibaculum sp. 1_MG-2023]